MSSSGDHISVDFATLQSAAGDLAEILKTLNEQLDLLYQRVEKAVLGWEGEARQTFVDQLDGHLTYASAHRAVLRGWGAA